MATRRVKEFEWLWCPSCARAFADPGDDGTECRMCGAEVSDGQGYWSYVLVRGIARRSGALCGSAMTWPDVPVVGEVYNLRVPESGWVWCLHCERVSLAAEWRVKGGIGFSTFEGLRLCPYLECDGGLYGDAWDYRGMWRETWRQIIEQGRNREPMPVLPVRGVRYPMY